jgi:hypothetical protein
MRVEDGRWGCFRAGVTILRNTNDEVGRSFPSAEESLTRLHRAGWSVNCTRFLSAHGPIWIVSGYNGENQVLTASATRDEAWWHACIQARSVGMLGPPVVSVDSG